jgi:hypothetical protein
MATEATKIPFVEAAAPATPAASRVVVYAKTDGLMYSKDDAGTETAMSDGSAAHIADTSDAHDASAISVLDTAANFAGTNVEAVLAELQDNIDGVSGGSGVGNLWKMAKGSGLGNQTLTNNTSDLITWDTAEVDGGGSVIDLANERFVIPATGFYLVIPYWRWGTTPPNAVKAIEVLVGATQIGLFRGEAATGSHGANGTLGGTVGASLTSGGFVTMTINPGTVTGVTANGSASLHTRCSLTLVRIT